MLMGLNTLVEKKDMKSASKFKLPTKIIAHSLTFKRKIQVVKLNSEQTHETIVERTIEEESFESSFHSKRDE
jgi:hypothetical protein